MFCPIFSHFSLEDGEPTTLTRERYLKLREAGFLFWSKGINSTHYSNSPASISTFNPKDTTEVKELKVLIEQQKDIIKEQKTLVSRYSTQIEQFLIWKDELDLKTSSMKDAIDQLQSIIASHEKKITALEEIGPRDNPNPLKRFKKLECQKHTHSTIQPSKEGDML
jgi:predicted RNase H-like nuclease (RuvC/YqgF family)